MIEYIKKKLASEFARNTIILTTGTSIAQFLPMLFYPILARVFAPNQFGLLATVTSLATILATISTGRYQLSILIAENKQDAADIIKFSLFLSILVLSASFVILSLFKTSLTHLFKEPGLKPWLYIAPLSALAINIFTCYNEWCVRNKYFKSLAYNKINNSGSTTLSKMFFGLVYINPYGLIIGDLIGRWFTALGCIIRTYRIDKSYFSSINYLNIKRLAKRYIDFPLYTLPGQLLNVVGQQIPIFIIGIYFNSIEVGYFSMTMNLLSVPSSILSLALRDIFKQKVSEEFVKNGECRRVFFKIIKPLILISTIGLIVLLFTLPFIFSLILGQGWSASGTYAQIVCPMIALSFISNSVGSILFVAEKQRVSLLWQIYYFTITLVSMMLGILLFKSITSTLILLTIGKSSAYLAEIFLSYKYSKPLKIYAK